MPAEPASAIRGSPSENDPTEVVMGFGPAESRTSVGSGEGRNRTGDTTVFSRVLYQLSYLARARSLAARPGPERGAKPRGFRPVRASGPVLPRRERPLWAGG